MILSVHGGGGGGASVLSPAGGGSGPRWWGWGVQVHLVGGWVRSSRQGGKVQPAGGSGSAGGGGWGKVQPVGGGSGPAGGGSVQPGGVSQDRITE